MPLKLAGAEVLELDAREIGVTVCRIGKSSRWGLQLFDSSAGGSGHVAELFAGGREWFERALQIMFRDEDHHRRCATACLRCLLISASQLDYENGWLQREQTHSLIQTLQCRIKLSMVPASTFLAAPILNGNSSEENCPGPAPRTQPSCPTNAACQLEKTRRVPKRKHGVRPQPWGLSLGPTRMMPLFQLERMLDRENPRNVADRSIVGDGIAAVNKMGVNAKLGTGKDNNGSPEIRFFKLFPLNFPLALFSAGARDELRTGRSNRWTRDVSWENTTWILSRI